MQKHAVILGIVGTLTITTVCAARRNSHHVHDVTSRASERVLPAPIVNPITASPTQTIENTKSSVEPARDWLSPEWVIIEVTSVYVIVSALTLLAIMRQANLMKQQAEISKESTQIARDAADAATLNAEALTNAERAWILVNHNAEAGGETWIFQFGGKNWGKAPAEIIYIRFRHRLLPADMALPDRPEYEDDESVFAQSRWIPPCEMFDIDDLNACFSYQATRPDVWEELTRGISILWLFGVIGYRNGISRKVHETRFCYFKSPQQGVNLVMGGPDLYNRCI